MTGVRKRFPPATTHPYAVLVLNSGRVPPKTIEVATSNAEAHRIKNRIQRSKIYASKIGVVIREGARKSKTKVARVRIHDEQTTTRWLRKRYPDFFQWLTSLVTDVDRYTVIRISEDDAYVHLFTAANEYTISIGKSYLGLARTLRMPYPGEEHRRGCDMHDGKHDYFTWTAILNDILRTELVTITHNPATSRKSRRKR